MVLNIYEGVFMTSVGWGMQASLPFEGDNWISNVVMQNAYHFHNIESPLKVLESPNSISADQISHHKRDTRINFNHAFSWPLRIRYVVHVLTHLNLNFSRSKLGRKSNFYRVENFLISHFLSGTSLKTMEK